MNQKSKTELVEDASPTLFSHVPTQKKRVSSELRAEEKKRQKVNYVLMLV